MGELVAFNNYLMIGMAPVLLLGNMVTMASRAEASAKRVLGVFNTPAQSRGGENAYRPDQCRVRLYSKMCRSITTAMQT